MCKGSVEWSVCRSGGRALTELQTNERTITTHTAFAERGARDALFELATEGAFTWIRPEAVSQPVGTAAAAEVVRRP